MRLLTLVQKEVGRAPNQRFRHEQWAPTLARDHGITLEFEAFESPALSEVLYSRGHVARKAAFVARDSVRRLRVLRHLHRFDGVVILREATLLGGAWLERLLHARGVAMMYDFDDVIWEPGRSPTNGLFAALRAPWKTSTICRLASIVTVGNAYLAAYARRFNSRVEIVRTSIDIQRFRPLPRSGDRRFTILYTGSHSTLANLETIRPALEEFGRRHPARLRVICDVPPRPFAHLEVDFVPWSPDTEAAALAEGDVGVMPLPDSSLARGKCGCKALQYMAMERPAIVSPVGINRGIVSDGRNGLHARTTEEWVSALERLAADSGLAQRLAVAGRHTVEAGYSAESSAAAFARAARALRRTGDGGEAHASAPKTSESV